MDTISPSGSAHVALSLPKPTTFARNHFILVETPKSGRKHPDEVVSMTLEWSTPQRKEPPNQASGSKDDSERSIRPCQVWRSARDYGAIRCRQKFFIRLHLGPKQDLGKQHHGQWPAMVQSNEAPDSLCHARRSVLRDYYVREHLVFQARLRMGDTSTAEQYLRRVDTVTEELGLEKCRDTLIGGACFRGISGGEHK